MKGRVLSREHPSWSVFTPGTTPALQPSGQKKHPSGYQRYGLNVCVPPTTSYVKTLTPSVMAFGGGAFGAHEV